MWSAFIVEVAIVHSISTPLMITVKENIEWWSQQTAEGRFQHVKWIIWCRKSHINTTGGLKHHRKLLPNFTNERGFAQRQPSDKHATVLLKHRFYSGDVVAVMLLTVIWSSEGQRCPLGRDMDNVKTLWEIMRSWSQQKRYLWYL